MSLELKEGTVFASRYQIVRRIASGGMGAVYEVVHLETERRRALKVMLPHLVQSDDLRVRFKREAKVAAHIESEFIVDVFDAGIDESTQIPFLVMEMLYGEELSKRLQRVGRFPPSEVVMCLHQTALALDKTHKAAIVHRDLKPENLFLIDREDGPPRIKVLDFGIAKIVAESATVGSTQTIGTPLYMAPEQFDPHARLTGAADLYALGMVAYTLLVGAPYWTEEASGNIFAFAAAASHGPREPASIRAAAMGVALPSSFDAWFAQATASDPAHRFPAATHMVRALAETLNLPPPGRASVPSLSSVAESNPPNQSAMPAPVYALAVPVPAPAPAIAPTPAQATASGATATKPIPHGRSHGVILGASLALGAVCILGGGTYFLSRRGTMPVADVSVKTATPTTTEVSTVGSTPVANARSVTPASSDAPARAASTASGTTVIPDADSPSARATTVNGSRSVPNQSTSRAVARATASPALSASANPSASVEKIDIPPEEPAPRDFDASEASAVIATIASSVKSCLSKDNITGNGRAKVTFASSGKVTYVVLLDSPFSGTSEGSCIISMFRSAKVAPFDGAPVSVTKSFSIP
jgi:eukaryotic-like serine/threonine-protein kinase